MKKIIGIVLCLATLLFCVACEKDKEVEIIAPENSVKMVATVDAIDEKITVNVTESEYTTGVHWVITNEGTEYYDGDKKTERDELKVGDTVTIYYSGQVMMSYPPQIVALQIRK